MAELPRHHAQLPAMMSFVSNEVVEKVDHVGGEVLPRRGRHRAAASDAETNQRDDSFAAAREGSRQLCGRTVRTSTVFGTATPWAPPIILIHEHLVL